jgi:hypothetical protein
MSRRNVERVRELSEAFERGDYAAAIEFFHPVVICEMGADTSVQGQTTWHGREGVWEANRQWLGTWEKFRSGVKEIIDADPHVVVVMWDEGKGRGSGVRVRREESRSSTPSRGSSSATRDFSQPSNRRWTPWGCGNNGRHLLWPRSRSGRAPALLVGVGRVPELL